MEEFGKAFMEASREAFVEFPKASLEETFTQYFVEALVEDFVKVDSTEAFVEVFFHGSFRESY